MLQWFSIILVIIAGVLISIHTSFLISQKVYIKRKSKKTTLSTRTTHLILPSLYLLILHKNGLNIITLLYCLFSTALLLLSIIDFKTYEIPIGINRFIGGIGIIRVLLDHEHLISYLIGFCCVSGFLLIIYILTKGRGIGGGDIKLMAVSGLILGFPNIIVAFILGCIVGSMIHIIRCSITHVEHRLAFGPYLSLGLFLSMLYGNQFITWYLNFY